MLASARRVLHSGSALLANAARGCRAYSAPAFPVPEASSSSPTLQPGVANSYTKILKIVEETGQDQKRQETARAQQKTLANADLTPFSIDSHIRPVDLRKDFRSKRQRPRRPREGPGRKEAFLTDPFLRFSIDPRHECENSQLMSEYVSELGKILPRAQTRVSHRTQRLLTKAIKRSKLMGIIPLHSKMHKTWYY